MGAVSVLIRLKKGLFPGAPPPPSSPSPSPPPRRRRRQRLSLATIFTLVGEDDRPFIDDDDEPVLVESPLPETPQPESESPRPSTEQNAQDDPPPPEPVEEPPEPATAVEPMDAPHLGTESPPLRSNILTSFLRSSRPRGVSQSQPSPVLDTSPSPPLPGLPMPQSPPSPGPVSSASHRRRTALPPTIQQPAATGGFTQMLRRRRSGGAIVNAPAPQAPLLAPAITPGPASLPSASSGVIRAVPGTHSHRIRLVPHIDSRRSLRFDPIVRDVVEGENALRIGRFTDRSGLGVAAANALGSNKLAFKSKVVSRAHAEVWCEQNGKFFIRDTKSSSGTFLNHVRLSAANTDSRPFVLRDGDTLQLGVDYQGGTEDIYKCVRIRVEIGREWQASANAFNTNALRQLRSLAQPEQPSNGVTVKSGDKKVAKSGFSDCCICLFSVTIQQALFIAPCSHAFHYKCIRPLLESHHPAFSCPLCRTYANLEEDVEVDAASIALDFLPEHEHTRSEQDEHGLDDAAGVVSDDAAEDLLSPRLARGLGGADPGAETEVEADGAGTGGSRRTRGGFVARHSLQEGTDDEEDDDDAEMVDAFAEPPLPPLPEGSPVPIGRLAMRSRSGSASSAGGGQGEGSGDSGEGMMGRLEADEVDRASKRKR